MIRVTLNKAINKKFFQHEKSREIAEKFLKTEPFRGEIMKSFTNLVKELAEKQQKDITVISTARRTLPLRKYKFSFWLFENRQLKKKTSFKFMPFKLKKMSFYTWHNIEKKGNDFVKAVDETIKNPVKIFLKLK